MHTFDAIVIGAGQAGPSLVGRLAGAGLRVALVERGPFGGTCVNNGCTPTKALIASAQAARAVQRAGEYGIRAGGAAVDMRCVKARKDGIVVQSRAALEHGLRSLANVSIFLGHARFSAAHTLQVEGTTLSAPRIFIDVGGRPLVPALPGIEAVDVLTSERMMDLDFVPAHLLIVGGSYVGLEFAQMYRRFGSAVTVIEMGPRLLGREDPDVSDAVGEVLAAEDIAIRLDARCIALAAAPEGISMRVDYREGAPQVSGSHVLLAVGRVPNTDDLGLAAAGIERDARGYIRVDERLQTSVEGVYALGDCNGRGAFTHTAYNDYEIVADNLLDGATRKVTDRLPIYALFTDPPLGRIGLTEREARERGHALLLGKRPMSEVARAREKGETQGFMKLLVDGRDGRLLGAAILGVGGDEAVQTLVDAMYAGTTCRAVREGVRIHPTVSELIPTVLGALQPVS